MPGTITTDLTLIDAAEATTNWLTVGTWGANPAASADIFLEQANAINARASAAAGPTERYAGSLVATASNLDLTTASRHLYFWIKCFSLPAMHTRAKGGIGISVSSDTSPTRSPATVGEPWAGPTNSKNWFVTGKDFEPESGWVCYVVDPTNTPDLTIGTPVMSTVNRAGIRSDALLVVGGGAVKPLPTMWDRIAYGSALTVNDGTAGAPVTLEDIYAADSLNANQYGILRKTVGVYLAAGKLNFGTTGQTAVTVVTDTNQVVIFQDFPVAAGFYEFVLNGAASFATTVTFGSISGTLTSKGCLFRGSGLTTRRLIAPVIVSAGTGYTANDILTVSGGTGSVTAQFKVITVSSGVITEIRAERAGVYSVPPTGTLSVTGGTGSSATFTATVVGGSIWTLTASAANQTLNMYACTLSEMKSAALASTTTIDGCTINNSGEITASGATIKNSSFFDLRITTPISASYQIRVTTSTPILTSNKYVNCGTAILWDRNADTNGKLDDSAFTSGGTGHAIELGTNVPSTIALTGITFSGYASSDGSTGNECIYNNSGKAVTINVSGGTTPTIRNGAGASTVVNSTVSVTVTPIAIGSEVRAYKTSDGIEVDGVESAAATSQVLAIPSGVAVDIVVLCYSPAKEPVRKNNVSFTVAQNYDPGQRDDRNFSNP